MSAPTQKLLIIGLCGDCIHVDWRQLDTVKHIKEQAFAAASANIAGVTSDQLSLVFGQGNDAVKLEDESVIQDCLSAHWSDITDAATQQFAAKQLRLSCAANDMDGFVEIELDREGRPKECEGGKSGASVKQSSYRDKCGVYIGRWRPNSKLDPALRTRVAVKVMEKPEAPKGGKAPKAGNRDIQHLVGMDFPYVNHFLGEFSSSRQLGVSSGSPLTIMVSSHCSGGDHYSAMHHPASENAPAYIIRLQAHADGQLQRFCFWNPDHPDESVNHGMEAPLSKVYYPPKGKKTHEVQAFPFSYVCVCDEPCDPSSPLAGIICRVERIDDRFFSLWSSDPLCRYPHAADLSDAKETISSSQFSSRFHSTKGSARCFMLLPEVHPSPLAEAEQESPTAIKPIRTFRKCMPRPNVSFLRAFSVQLLRGLGYCHSCKLTSHNDLRTVNIFHRNPLTAHHLLCATPPYYENDPHAMLRAIKVELGDFGKARALPVDADTHVDFRYAAMAILSTLNFWFFLPAYQDFESTLDSTKQAFHLPSADCILSQCSHFVELEAKHLFCDLVTKLFQGPQAPTKAWSFAEHLLKTHAFFAPLRTEAAKLNTRAPPGDSFMESYSPSDADVVSDEVRTLSRMFAGVDPSPNSRFQHLLGDLNKFVNGLDTHDTQSLLAKISASVQSSNPTALSETIQFGALEVLLRTLRSPRCNFKRKVLSIIFQILDSCPNQRHILMQITHVERETGESVLQYLVKFVSSEGVSAAAEDDAAASIPDIIAAAVRCIKSVVACSIPYRSLSDFPDCGCYGSPKMGSMMTAKVLQSIAIAIEDEVTSDSRGARDWKNDEIAHRVLQVFFQDSEHTASYFSEHRSVLRAIVQESQTVQEFRRLNSAE